MNAGITKTAVTKSALSGTRSSSHHARQPKKLWNILSSILGSSKPKQLPKNIPFAQNIHLDFFNNLDFFNKVEAVRGAPGQGPTAMLLPPATSTINGFHPYM